MQAAIVRTCEMAPQSEEARSLTLLDLVAALIDSGSGDCEVVAAVVHLVHSGKVRLVGQFLGKHISVEH